MAEDLDRDRIIGLLESLGSERDEDVVEAAREIHAQVTAAGVTWDALLAPVGTAVDEAFEEGTADEEAAEPAEADGEAAEREEAEREEADGEDAQFAEADGEDAAPTPARDRGNKESLALIARLLAKSDISKDMREELQGYKEDIAEGEFEDMDRKYLRALHARLTKRR
ncbi:MAG: hypothetical protein O6829_02340 [Alphaproteobacteria bacterium]|nr:hypothetical protein [Pseudomonadota bacterium]MCZ6466099.1 hypothetical protein [Alphaproteobacteria bacterium]MCZ6606753.1 hypothetical protein [Alphaproteobacteria bacterium]